MEKLEKRKHDHKLTHWLKFGIFAVIMVAPFFSVLARTMYVVVNKNAKDSYSDNLIKEKVSITAYTDFVEGEIYNFQTKHVYQNVNVLSRRIYFTNSNFNYVDMGLIDREYYSITIADLGNPNNLYYWMYYNDNQYQQITIPNDSVYSKFTLQIDRIEGTQTGYPFNVNTYVYQTNMLDNVFEYSINKLKENNLYNWSKETGIYTAINNMISGLGANDVLAMLLAYWGILTAVYIVFDIVIECFTKLTHLLTE